MKTKRILFSSAAANLGGLQSSTHSRIRGIKAKGVHSEKLFLKSGAGRETYSDVPTHITDRPSQMAKILRSGNFDSVSMINRTDLLPALRKTHYRGRVLFEARGRSKHALKVTPKLKRKDVGGIVVISHYVERMIRRALRSKEIPVHVVYNAVDTSLFRPLLWVNKNLIPHSQDAAKRPIVLWVGRLSENKNYTEMLQVAQILIRRGSPLPMFWVVADTNAKDNTGPFWRKVSELGLREHVRLLECIPHRSMVHIYNLVARSGGCVLSTSKSEGFQNSLLEGMACGAPVVSSAVGGNVELIENGVNGRLYPLGRPQKAADCIVELLSDATFRKACVQAGLAHIRLHHTPERHAARFMEVLESTPVLSFSPTEKSQRSRHRLRKRRKTGGRSRRARRRVRKSAPSRRRSVTTRRRSRVRRRVARRRIGRTRSRR